MMDVPRIDAATARRRMAAGKTLLVCAYEDEERCRKNWIDGAITMPELRDRLPRLSLDQELIFYCA